MEAGQRSTLRSRLIYAVLVLLIIAAGLLWRWPALSLPPAMAKYGGSILWGGLVYLALRVALPKPGVAPMALLAATIAAAVEFTQLLHWPWLDAFRGTTFGALLLGRVFTWWDILCYWLGIAAIGMADRLCRGRRIQEAAELPG